MSLLRIPLIFEEAGLYTYFIGMRYMFCSKAHLRLLASRVKGINLYNLHDGRVSEQSTDLCEMRSSETIICDPVPKGTVHPYGLTQNEQSTHQALSVVCLALVL